MSPHAHFLGIFTKKDKVNANIFTRNFLYEPRTVDDFDRMVSAEIPDPTTTPRLYEKVTSHMLHCKCGVHDEYGYEAPCMPKEAEQNGVDCPKHFPKDFLDETNGTKLYFFQNYF